MSKPTIQKFYDAFQSHDALTMSSFYHPKATFSDPIFQNLNQKEVQGMWEMLIERSDGQLEIDFHSLVGNDQLARGTWEAKYQFSKTKRDVHNIIYTTMEFKDGLIIKHTDDFNFWRWSIMALGISGSLLGWTPILKRKVRKMAMASLQSYLSK